MTTIAKQFMIFITSFSLFGAGTVFAEPIKADSTPKRLEISLPDTSEFGGKQHKVSKINEQQFIDLFGIIVKACDADSKQFGTDAANALTKIFSLQNNPNAKGVFSISPMFNRDILVATLMVGNKIKLDDDDFERIKKTFAEYARKTDNKDEQMLIAIIYGSLLAEWKYP